MELKVHIKEIDFTDVILKAMPVFREKAPDGSAVSKIISVVTQLPREVIRTMLDTVSREDQYEILTLLVKENKEKIRQALVQLLNKNGIDLTLNALNLSDELVLSMSVSDLNYPALAEKYLPMVRDSLTAQENPVTAMLAVLLKLPSVLLYGALAKIPQNKKDEAVAYLINRNKDRIIAKIEDLLVQQDIHILLGDLNVEV